MTASSSYVTIEGRWSYGERRAEYLGPIDGHGNASIARPFGLCLSSSRLSSGRMSVLAKIGPSSGSAARIAFGHNVQTGSYYSVGLNGYGSAFLVDLFTPGQGWRSIKGVGAASELSSDRQYRLSVAVQGQQVGLSVDDIPVVDTFIPTPLEGDQTGLFAWGMDNVTFEDFRVETSKPTVFIVMQFGEPYDHLYRHVIVPVCEQLDFAALRADDVFQPGVILEDIRRGLVSADVIVAEITPANPNVFYELGYAHALGKPTILLADRTLGKLPFDVSGYRTIFYDNSIGGKQSVEETLKKHLLNIQRGSGLSRPEEFRREAAMV